MSFLNNNNFFSYTSVCGIPSIKWVLLVFKLFLVLGTGVKLGFSTFIELLDFSYVFNKFRLSSYLPFGFVSTLRSENFKLLSNVVSFDDGVVGAIDSFNDIPLRSELWLPVRVVWVIVIELGDRIDDMSCWDFGGFADGVSRNS